MMAPVGLGMRFSRLKTFRASSNGQALLTWACASSSELTSIFGASLGFGLAANAGCAPWLMLASACGSAWRRLRGLVVEGRGMWRVSNFVEVPKPRQVSQIATSRQYFRSLSGAVEEFAGLAPMGAIAYGRAAFGPQRSHRGIHMTEPLNHHAALIYVMVTMSAVDRTMTDAELSRIGEIVSNLPVF